MFIIEPPVDSPEAGADPGLFAGRPYLCTMARTILLPNFIKNGSV
jgi:hypothetical protein